MLMTFSPADEQKR